MTIPIRWLTEQLAITGQIDPEDALPLAQMGFKTIVCNRPDFEFGPDQPTADAIEQAVIAAGMAFRHLPVSPDGGSADDANAMGQLLAHVPTPVLAYCKTGGRCMALIGVAARLGHPIPR